MRIVTILLCLMLFSQPLKAQEAMPAPAASAADFKDLKHTASGKIDKVIDGKTLLLKDGKIIALLGLDYPVTLGGGGDGGPVPAAKQFLENRLPEGTDVTLYQARNPKTGRTDRMGHALAHVVLKKDGGWINGLLVAGGYAYAVTTQGNPQMAAQLYALEDKARRDKTGIWMAESPYALLTPETAGRGNGLFRVVEGRIEKSALSNNNLYLNFGNDYRKDFTVMVPPAIRKALSRSGIDPMSLAGRDVRVRGWIRFWNGPFMELDTPERLEILTAPPPSPAPEIPSGPQARPAPVETVNP